MRFLLPNILLQIKIAWRLSLLYGGGKFQPGRCKTLSFSFTERAVVILTPEHHAPHWFPQYLLPAALFLF